MTIGPFFFAAPWALAALAALPLLFILLRAAPPAPNRQFFPPLQLLLGLKTEEETKQRAPLWLVLLRALAAALMIIGFARPSLAPQARITNSGPSLIVIDDGWPSAPTWSQAQSAAEDAIADAERAEREIFILTTAPQRTALDAGAALNPADARARIARLQPSPWRPDRADAQKRLPKAPAHFATILWITDGLDDPGSADFARALQTRGPVTARIPVRTAQAITAAADTAQGVEAEIHRAPTGPPMGAIAAETLQGRSLGAGEYKYDITSDAGHARIDLPPEIAGRVSRVRIVGESSAGAMRLLPSGAGRPFVGLVDPGGQAQPLLSDLFYVERAIAPFATSRRGDVRSLIQGGAQAIVLPDASRLSPPERNALLNWIQNGGLLIRFAGPRLANDADDLLPVKLRPGARALGGALAWETPQPIAPFPDESPFAGLTPPQDVTVRRQVLAEPSAEREGHVWARLQDGASIVTAAPKGKGLMVLFQVTAGPDWSDLPLSGLYVDMLRRTLAFAGRAQGATEERVPTGPWLPERLIDGYGALAQPNSDAQPIPAEAMDNAKAGPATPPGLYVRAGSPAIAIDTAAPNEVLKPIALPNGVQRAELEGAKSHALSGVFLGIAALMIALDLLLALILTGAMPRLRSLRPAATTAAVLALALVALPHDNAHAQAQGAAAATLDTRLAYIKTGDARRDRITAAGLQALSDTLTERTSVEPGEPIGIDPARDDLSPFPILYWAAPDEPHRLPDAALAAIDRYMRLGGLLFVDTRDSGKSYGGAPGPAAIMLQGLDAPPLEQVGAQHVLTKTFYLMQSFPGRFSRTKIYAESANAAAARDGVPALIIGDGDWASMWATDGFGDPEGGGGRQRELSLRFGVNLVMLALTGNYKADQVHVPALLERLGESRRNGGGGQ